MKYLFYYKNLTLKPNQLLKTLKLFFISIQTVIEIQICRFKDIDSVTGNSSGTKGLDENRILRQCN